MPSGVRRKPCFRLPGQSFNWLAICSHQIERHGNTGQEFEPFYFAEGVNKLEDLSVGMKLPGVVTNVTDFGAFVDVGVHQDGLVHISQLSDRFVRNPSDIVKAQQRVWVTLLEIDLERKRISLSMKS